LKKIAKIFADSKIVITFAVPLERNGGRVQPDRLFFLAPFLKEFIEKTDIRKYKQVPRTTRALILLNQGVRSS